MARDAGIVYPEQGVFANNCILLRFPSSDAVWWKGDKFLLPLEHIAKS